MPHLDDELSLAEFAQLWWADQVPKGGSADELQRFLDRKQASMRMRRRMRPGFPEPSGTAGRTRLYRLGALAAWMSDTTSDAEDPEVVVTALEARLAQVAPQWHLRRAESACQRRLGTDAARRLVVAVAVVLESLGMEPGARNLPTAARAILESGDGLAASLRRRAPTLERRLPSLAGVLTHLLSEIPDHVPGTGRLAPALAKVVLQGIPVADVVDLTLEHLPSAPAAGGGAARTASGLSRLMVAVADPWPGARIMDLAAGQGDLLLQAAGATGGEAQLSGFEPDPRSWAVAKSRFHLRGLDVHLHLGKSLDGTQPLPKADVVLADPPLTGRRSYRRWLSYAAGCTTAHGRAVVALPGASLSMPRGEWRALSPLVETVVKAPNRLRTDRGEALALWVLTARPAEDILVVNAAHLGRQRGALSTVSASEAALLRTVTRRWRDDGAATSAPPVTAQATGRTAVPAVRAALSQGLTTMQMAPPLPVSGSIELERQLLEAHQLAQQLASLVDGPLRSHTSQEHRRALRRLLVRLERALPSALETPAGRLRRRR